MNNRVNSILLVCLGVSIGVIAMLLRDKSDPPEQKTAAGSGGPAESSTVQNGDTPQVSPPSAIVSSERAEPRGASSLSPAPEISSDDFEAQMMRVFQGKASVEEQLAFWDSVRNGDNFDRVIEELQTDVEADAEDTSSRLNLAQAYVTKILSSIGPEKGIWAEKALTMWNEVLAIEPENWEAQHSIGFSYSQYPDFLNMTGRAIAEYEKTITLQESATDKGSRFPNSYLELSRLHIKNGDPSSALALLEQGVAAHPDSEALADQLAVISSSFKFEDAAAE